MKKPRILLVDDDEEICEEIGGLLKDSGFKIMIAHEGSAAVRLLEGNSFDLLILDLKVPGMSGIEILRHVRGRRLPVKVLIVTGKPLKDMYEQDESPLPEDPEQDELFQLADGFVGKPFEIEVLLARIKTLTL
ncbi:MAG TPA: response regulator [Candidatus Omnitrophota bacterium]|nr:response regulator [Candidatus Omnitrophota bacterium]HQJ15976.1 response regulator [Candidatus Omnitrophota bacterium]